MASAGFTRAIAAATGINILITSEPSQLLLNQYLQAIAGAVLYNTNQKLERNHEEAEARMDELEGTLRGHIGLIEESLERLEGKAKDGAWGQEAGSKAKQLYESRGRDEKK